VCNINGTSNLCYITGGQNVGYVRGYAVILDNTYTTRTSVHSLGGVANFDEHEFNVLADGTSLFTLYNPEHYDLSAYNITSGQGWIMNSFFQHIDIATNRLLFEWNSLDHVPLSETFVLPATTESSGDGFSSTTPWDYFHINSVDQNADGDYLVSARHTCTVYKVSGQDGHIIWRLGGAYSDFSFPAGLNFSFQHDARFRQENASTTIISLFDNASNGYNQTSRYSSGKILALNMKNMSVYLLQDFIAPYYFISPSQGNVQFIGGGGGSGGGGASGESSWRTSNAFLGWGKNAYISEYTPAGVMVQEGHFATEGAMNYRAFKGNWTGHPRDGPALYTYARNESTPTRYWVSWNGATEVAKWKIYSSNSRTGPWTVVGTINKNGFETAYTAGKYWPWSIVESLDKNNKAIRNSTRAIRTFVPSQELASICDVNGCPSASVYRGVGATATQSSPNTPTPSSTGNVGTQKLKRTNDGEWSRVAMFGMGAGIGAFMV
jgi:hypothetical protein